MPLETGTTIADLDTRWPLSSDPVSAGDDHIRLLKAILQSQFPNFDSVLSVSSDELNFMDGVTSSVQAQLDAITGATDAIPSGTVMSFFQAAAPVGWTQITAHTDAALRVVSGAGGGTGGTDGFSTMSAHVHGTSGHVLTTAELPSHTHPITVWSGVDTDATPNFVSGRVTDTGGTVTGTLATNATGSDSSHTHGDTAASSFAPKYLDMILASKD
jgi:hypothetical protein